MNRNSNRSALAALAIAGGLFAWRNRDKIQSWFNSQRQQFTSGQGSFTGETRRMGEAELPSYESTPKPSTYTDPTI
jgi:hypothetical protein